MKEKNIITLDIKKAESKPQKPPNRLKSAVQMLVYCLCGLLIGIITGGADALFGIVLLKITDFRENYPYWLIPFLAIGGLIICFLYERFGKEVKNGMAILFDRVRNERTEIKLRLIPFVTVSTWITHLFGGSAGREGVAVQIGGTLGSFVAREVRIDKKNSAKILTIAGMAAGFGGLFRTPIAAVFFATEVLCAGALEVTALLPALISAYTASFVSGKLGLEKFTVISDVDFHIDINTFVPFCIAAVCFGIIGGGFAFVLKNSRKLISKVFPNIYLRIAAGGAAVSIVSLILYGGRYSGLGTNLIESAFNNGQIYYWDFLLKFLLTIVTISVGFQGGEVTPLFAIGAAFGTSIAIVFNMPVVLFAALGYAAVFGAATNTLIAPMFIGAEVFGFRYMPYFFAVCVIAYIFNGNNCIYSNQINKQTDSIVLNLKK